MSSAAVFNEFTFPVEIWEEIFSQVVDPPSHFKGAGFNTTEFVEFNPKSVLQLSQTSRFFRQLVVSCPVLWACIPSVWDVYNEVDVFKARFQRRLKLILLFIERAQGHPLCVTFINEYDRKSGKNTYDEDMLFFWSTSNRWKSLTIKFQCEHVLEGYAQDIECYSKNNPILPSLRTLEIRHRKYLKVPSYLPNPIRILLSAPQLQYLDFTGVHLNGFFLVPWNQIKYYSGAVIDFSLIGTASNTVQELVLKRNLLGFKNPTQSTPPFYFSKLTKLTFENISFRKKWINTYDSRRTDDTVLRWIEAPCLQRLDIIDYQALPQAPSIIDDLTSSMLRFPHNSLVHITFHVGGLTRQSLANLLSVTPNLETLELSICKNEILSSLRLASNSEDAQFTGRDVVVPKLRHLIIQEWNDMAGGAQIFLDIFDTRQSDAAASKGVSPLESVILVYNKRSNYVMAWKTIVRSVGYDSFEVLSRGSTRRTTINNAASQHILTRRRAVS